jgi:hypothetical protein
MTAATHAHSPTRQIRRFAGRPGVWVHVWGEWCRPMVVSLYRGAWRATCWVCGHSLDSGDDLYGRGWPTPRGAYEAAERHCGECAP